MHTRVRYMTILAVPLLATALTWSAARADWNPGDAHKMHFPQLPDPNGFDVEFIPSPVAGQQILLADDWRCSETGPVEDIHFWFSSKGDSLNLGHPIAQQIFGVGVKIRANIPAALPGQPGLPYSTPGAILWQREFNASDFPGKVAFRLYGTGQQAFWHLPFGAAVLNDHQNIFQCNITDISSPFCQHEGDVYWLEVTMSSAQPTGWKSSDRNQYPPPYTGQHYEDDAVYHWQQVTDWQELHYPIGPYQGQSMDLAFVISGDNIQWNHKMHFPQEPDPIGADILFTQPKVLADDWRCSESGPVEDIHFWFSAIYDWLDLSQPLPLQIFNIHLSIHADLPAGTGGITYSRPGALLWQRDIPITAAGGIQITRCDTPGQDWYDPNTGVYIRNNHKALYRCDITNIPAPFIQQQGTIYWLDVYVASEQPLGWKTADIDRYPAPYTGQHFQDDAVWGDLPNPFWTDLRWPQGSPRFGQSIDLAFVITRGGPTGVEPQAPNGYRLMQNYPNPFNPTTTIRYELPVRADVQLAVYGVGGQLIRVLQEGSQPAGTHAVPWDGRDTSGKPVASGVYFYRLKTAAFSETRKMVLMK